MKKKFVIYTVMVGGYEDIIQPLVIDDRFDYILFTDNMDAQHGIWQNRSIPDVIQNDNKRLSRYPKSHPETVLSEYKASLYIDANIQIQDRWVYDRVVELYNQNVEYAGVKLLITGHDCIYDHAFEMCQFLVEHEASALKQCRALYKRGFPRHFGLNENNIIYRMHTDKMKVVDEEWWWWITNYSFRDQFSYMYCIWKYEIPINYFLPLGEDSRNGVHFKLTDHNGSKQVNKVKIVKRGVFEKLRVKCKSFDVQHHRDRWHKFYKTPLYLPYLYLDGIYTILSNIPNLMSLVKYKK